LKRGFYTTKVDTEFEKTLGNASEDELKEFNKYCTLFSGLGSLGFARERKWFEVMFKYMHLAYFLLLPMNIPYTWLIPALISIMNMILGDKKTSDGAVSTFFSEETTNLGLVGMLLFSGKNMAFLLKLCLGLWSLMHVADIVKENTSDDFALSQVADTIVYSKVELT
jgi:hypothetical protein